MKEFMQTSGQEISYYVDGLVDGLQVRRRHREARASNAEPPPDFHRAFIGHSMGSSVRIGCSSSRSAGLSSRIY